MASIRERTDKTGKTFFTISYRENREAPERSMTWHPPEGWSRKAIQRELAKISADFELRCRNGEILTRKEKAAIEAKTEQQRKEQEAKQPTLKQYAEAVFMPDKRLNTAAGTVMHYENILKLYIYPKLGDQKLEAITPVQIRKTLADYQKQFSHGTVIHIFSTLTGIFKMAVLDDTVDRNPMDKVPRPRELKQEKKNGPPEAYTAEQVAYIMQCLETEPLRWRAFTMLMIDTGARRGEICGLKWEDIDLTTYTITIRRSLNYNPKCGSYFDATKTGKARTVDVDPAVLQLLLQFRKEMQQNLIVSPYVFPRNTSADPIHPHDPNRWMQRFAKKYGIEHLHPHKLRHTMASISIEAGADIASVAMKLGHAQISTTLDTYTHSHLEAVRKTGYLFRNAVKAAQKAPEEQEG